MLRPCLDIAAITESALDATVRNEDIDIDGYTPLRKDLKDNATHGGVTVYVKNTLVSKQLTDLEFDSNILVLEIFFGKKRVFLTTVYRRPSQTIEQEKEFLTKLNNLCCLLNRKNPYASIITGSWWNGDKTDPLGTKLDKIFLDNHLTQLVKEPTHLRGNSASCIDLVATSQPNFFAECVILPSIHETCHHLIVQCKFLVDIPPPSPYKRRVWHYNRADTQSIQNAILEFDWQTNLDAHSDDVNTQATFLTTTLTNIFHNFIPFKDITVKPKDPPWMQKNIKIFYNKYRRVFRDYMNQGRPLQLANRISEMKKHLSTIVAESHNKYLNRLGAKLKNSSSGPKAYHTALKKLMGQSKFSVIPPILSDNLFISDSLDKAKIFNTFFANQCTMVNTDSTLPDTPTSAPPFSISNVSISESKIKDFLIALNLNKSHGHDI